MSRDPHKGCIAHGSRIDVNQEQEYWAERLDVYPGELKQAVTAAGDIDERKHDV